MHPCPMYNIVFLMSEGNNDSFDLTLSNATYSQHTEEATPLRFDLLHILLVCRVCVSRLMTLMGQLCCCDPPSVQRENNSREDQ